MRDCPRVKVTAQFVVTPTCRESQVSVADGIVVLVAE